MSKFRYSVDLIRQIAVCDANYIRLLKLLPQLAAAKHEVSQGTEHGKSEKALEGTGRKFYIADLEDNQEKVTVEIRILEAFKYTTTLEILQKPELKTWMTNPSMLVRVYHDANTAEVISYQGHRNFKTRYPQPNARMYHTDEKLQVNQFLGEWLSHCLREGRSLEMPVLVSHM
ncbi:MAG: DUF1249 domain-containing protein [Gammaproteobacteria bacterium]|nr:DUF1249 domain-containing protein [Gammaproteobacteria bacterium]MCY4357161.1 DUF1249 domain-containing protein [Gammaproteobacteria bacterium]